VLWQLNADLFSELQFICNPDSTPVLNAVFPSGKLQKTFFVEEIFLYEMCNNLITFIGIHFHGAQFRFYFLMTALLISAVMFYFFMASLMEEMFFMILVAKLSSGQN
jgi:hypothetical protein